MFGLRKASPELPLMTLIVMVFEPATNVPVFMSAMLNVVCIIIAKRVTRGNSKVVCTRIGNVISPCQRNPMTCLSFLYSQTWLLPRQVPRVILHQNEMRVSE